MIWRNFAAVDVNKKAKENPDLTNFKIIEVEKRKK